MADPEDYYSDAASQADIELLLSSISKLSNVAFFVYNEQDSRPLYISKQLPRFYRMSMSDFLERFDTNEKVAANMVGEDGPRYLVESGFGSYEADFRGYRSDGTICFLREVGENIWDPASQRTLRSAGAVIDITALKETEQALQNRTDELVRSLEELRTAQDRLVQAEKLASLGQLTAGIAHEIKNPLNFVNNFAALSIELIDELTDSLDQIPVESSLRDNISDITRVLKSNLDKVVQHGRRADSIVKNMLLHSRQGSGEHRLTSINTVVEDSINLAYHGARAQRKDFNISLERDFDLAAGEADVYSQDISRALLNLISNGLYATGERSAQIDDYEPVLRISTRNLGDCVEIRIRDNGTGIPAEVKERIFDPFFTTKPAGEGTGLGLSLSHDIIVKQHSGILEVESQPNVFTEFRIVLPRAAISSAQKVEFE